MTNPTPEQVAEKITHEEARAILSRFNNSHWDRNDKARYSIPADPTRDDDLRLAAYIDQQEALSAASKVREGCVAACQRIVEETDEWRPPSVCDRPSDMKIHKLRNIAQQALDAGRGET